MPYKGTMAMGTVMGEPDAGIPDKTTYEDGWMDQRSAQLQGGTLVFGEPPAEADHARRQSVIPTSQSAPLIDESDTLYRETLLFMRIQLKSDKKMFDSVKVMNTVLQNILKYP